MTGGEGVVRGWGSTSAERAAAYPCDRLLDEPDDVLFRAVTVEAGAPVVFRWLCQLKVAPYSYDWIDNGGRASPPRLTPGAEALTVGESVMRIFRLAVFERDRHVTLLMADPSARRLFGDIAGSYSLLPLGEQRCRLVVKLLVRNPSRLPGSWFKRLLPAGDLVMMRKQLLNLKRLAESTTPASASG